MKPQLISFKLCPFVQRSVIVLKHKGIDFDIDYIDINDPPEWFKELSPLGKVPVLKVGDTVLFESAVIMEYLDEVNPPSLHPTDPLQKAQNRAWVEFASEQFFAQHRMLSAGNEEAFNKEREALRRALSRLEGVVVGPFFNGEAFSLADCAYAPLFMRLQLLRENAGVDLLEGLPRLAAWSEQLLACGPVQESVVPELPQLYRGMIDRLGGYASGLLTE